VRIGVDNPLGNRIRENKSGGKTAPRLGTLEGALERSAATEDLGGRIQASEERSSNCSRFSRGILIRGRWQVGGGFAEGGEFDRE